MADEDEEIGQPLAERVRDVLEGRLPVGEFGTAALSSLDLEQLQKLVQFEEAAGRGRECMCLFMRDCIAEKKSGTVLSMSSGDASGNELLATAERMYGKRN